MRAKVLRVTASSVEPLVKGGGLLFSGQDSFINGGRDL